MTENVNFTSLDTTVYPMDSIYDVVQDKHIHMDDFEFDETIWDTPIPPEHIEYIPEGHIPEEYTKRKSFWEKIENIENKVKEQYLIDILEDIKPDLFGHPESKKKKKATKSVRKRKTAKNTAKKPSKNEDVPCVFRVDKIVDHYGDWSNIEQMQFKVRWHGYDESEDTWEPFQNLDNCIRTLEEYCEQNR